jgi:hypothetical protein
MEKMLRSTSCDPKLRRLRSALGRRCAQRDALTFVKLQPHLENTRTDTRRVCHLVAVYAPK